MTGFFDSIGEGMINTLYKNLKEMIEDMDYGPDRDGVINAVCAYIQKNKLINIEGFVEHFAEYLEKNKANLIKPFLTEFDDYPILQHDKGANLGKKMVGGAGPTPPGRSISMPDILNGKNVFEHGISTAMGGPGTGTAVDALLSGGSTDMLNDKGDFKHGISAATGGPGTGKAVDALLSGGLTDLSNVSMNPLNGGATQLISTGMGGPGTGKAVDALLSGRLTGLSGVSTGLSGVSTDLSGGLMDMLNGNGDATQLISAGMGGSASMTESAKNLEKKKREAEKEVRKKLKQSMAAGTATKLVNIANKKIIRDIFENLNDKLGESDDKYDIELRDMQTKVFELLFSQITIADLLSAFRPLSDELLERVQELKKDKNAILHSVCIRGIDRTCNILTAPSDLSDDIIDVLIIEIFDFALTILESCFTEENFKEMVIKIIKLLDRIRPDPKYKELVDSNIKQLIKDIKGSKNTLLQTYSDTMILITELVETQKGGDRKPTSKKARKSGGKRTRRHR